MIFFKKQQEQFNRLEEMLQKSFKQLHVSLEDHRLITEELKQAVKRNGANTEKQSMALEDVLEAVDQKWESEQFMSRRVKELEEAESELLSLAIDYQEQLFLIEHSVKNLSDVAGTWENQFDSVSQALLQHMADCGITVIAEPEQAVDYHCHEVIKIVDTEVSEMDRTVSQVYSPGFIYKGAVQKKAKIAAYRLAEPLRK